MSRTLTRNLAKDGLLDDGKEALLTGPSLSFLHCPLLMERIEQLPGFAVPAISYHNTFHETSILSYCPPMSAFMAHLMRERSWSNMCPSFAALDAHMKVLKEEAMALAAVNMNAVEARESRDSKEDKDTGGDKKRKPKTSAGVEKLKKANIKGMAKLSTFFQKK